MNDLVIIGSGPYGLALSAHSKASGLRYKTIGFPMSFWEEGMPKEMFIRTELEYSNISDPFDYYTLKKFEEENNLNLTYPLKRSIFIEYGKWFVRKTGIDIEEDCVIKIEKEDSSFKVFTKKGKLISTKNVVVAVGLTNSYYIPEPFANFNSEFVSHSSFHTKFDSFANKKVIVVGGGQSAWESAALLNEANAEVTLCYRRAEHLLPEKNLNQLQHKLASKFYDLPIDEKIKIRKKIEKPTVSDFLIPLVKGKVTEKPSCYIEKIKYDYYGKLRVYLSTQEHMEVDHVIFATGFKFSPQNIPFLKNLYKDIELELNGTPSVDRHFQSSVEGLFFAGPATASNHGPTFRFIAGTSHTAKSIVGALSKTELKQ